MSRRKRAQKGTRKIDRGRRLKNPRRCKGCGLRIRGKNHDQGTHHNEHTSTYGG